MHVVKVSGRVAIRDLSYFLSADLCKLVQGPILGYGLKEGVDHRVRVSLSALNPETTVEEPGVHEHLPDNRVAPIVWLHLRIDRQSEIVVPRFQHLRHCHHLIQRDAYQILPELFKSDFEGCLVILALAHSVTNNSVAVSDKKQDSASIYSVQSSHISD